MKTIAASMLVLLIAAAAFATGSEETASVEPVEIIHMVADRNIIPPEEGTIDDNWYTRLVNERLAPLGITVSIIGFPRWEYDAKVATFLASGDAPDVMWSWAFPPYSGNIPKWSKEEGLLDYGLYLEEHGPNILQLYSEKDLQAGQYDGKQTALKRLQTQGQWGIQTFVRQDYLDILGLEVPTTFDEVSDVMVTMKANADKLGHDPANFWAYATQTSTHEWYKYLLPAFLTSPPDGEKMSIPPQLWPEAKDALRFLNRLYNEGLAPDLTLDTDQSIWKQMLIEGRVGVIPWWTHGPIFTGYGSIYAKMREVNPDARLTAIYPWTSDPDEPYYHDLLGNPGYGLAFISPASTEYPVQVVQYLDYMASDEGRTTIALGIEGEHWEPVGDNDFRRLVDDDTVNNRIAWIQPQWETLALAFDEAGLNAKVAYGSMAHADEYVMWAAENGRRGTYTAPVINLPSPARNRYYNIIEGDWKNALAKIVTVPPSEFDAVFDAAITAYRANGGDEVVAEAVANYREWAAGN